MANCPRALRVRRPLEVSSFKEAISKTKKVIPKKLYKVLNDCKENDCKKYSEFFYLKGMAAKDFLLASLVADLVFSFCHKASDPLGHTAHN